MELDSYIEEVHRQLAVAAAAGGEEAKQLAERLSAPLDATLRLTLLEALGAAAAEITRELAPGSVDVRLRGRDPEFVVSLPPAEAPQEHEPAPPQPPADDAAMTRINLRLPDQLKNRIEQAAEKEGLSINAWLVRAASAAVERGFQRVSTNPSSQQFRGWVS